MPTRIYLSPAQHANPGACSPNGRRYYEDEWCRKVANRAAYRLRKAGLTVKVSTNWSWDNYVGAASQSNAWGADIHVPIHSNAGNGKMRGTDTFYHPSSSSGKRLALKLLVHVSKVSGTKRSNQPKSWHELSATRAVAGYLELDFHDNPAGCRHIASSHKRFGDAVAAGIMDYLGVRTKKKSRVPAAARALRAAFLALPEKWQEWVIKYAPRWRRMGH